jgi:hypothetical protein
VIAQDPRPGITVPGVQVPIPGEKEATDAAVSNGQLIAAIIVTIVVISVGAWLWRNPLTKIVLAFAAGIFLTYIVVKATYGG